MTDALLPTNGNYSDEQLLPVQYTPNPDLDNDISKLMYYLNPNNISKEEEEIILNLASKYKPKILIDNGVFIINQELLQGNSSNEFYQLNDQRIQTTVNPNILIEGNVINVLQIMACNYNWISTYYHEPIESINKKKLNMANASNQQYQQPIINGNNNNGNLAPFQVNQPNNASNNMALDVNAINNRNNRVKNNRNECCSETDAMRCCAYLIGALLAIIVVIVESS